MSSSVPWGIFEEVEREEAGLPSMEELGSRQLEVLGVLSIFGQAAIHILSSRSFL